MMSATDTEKCGACGRQFEDLDALVEHDCPEVSGPTADMGLIGPTATPDVIAERLRVPATEKQVRLIARLGGGDMSGVTREQASAAIDALMRTRFAGALPDSVLSQGDVAAALAEAKYLPNRFAGRCRVCKRRVPVGAGRLVHTENGYALFHVEPCRGPEGRRRSA